jgi:hypothetical protein
MHSASNTGRHVRTGEDMRYTRMAIEIFNAYLPEEKAKECSKKARETYARSTLDTAYSMYLKWDLAAMFTQLREAISFSHSLNVIRYGCGLLLQAARVGVQRMIRGQERA